MSIVSIIIAVHNGLDYTKRCVAVLQRSLGNRSYELIVVDDASKDGSLEWLSKQSGVQIIHNDYPHGMVEAFNQGARKASGNALLFLRNEALLMGTSFDLLLQMLWHDDITGAVGPVTNYSEYTQTFNEATYQNYIELERFVNELPNHNRGKEVEPTLLLGDFCLCVKRVAWAAIQGFDSGYAGIGSMADADFSLRLLEKGYQLSVVKKAYVHREAVLWQDLQTTLDEEKTRGKTYFEQKWKFCIDYSCSIRIPLLRHIDMNIKPLSILEAGCACGGNLMYLKRVKPSVELYGIELDEHTARIASRFGKIFNLDLERFSKPEWKDKFDAIIMGDILEHLVDPWKMVRNMYAITKPGGQIIVSVPNVMHLSVLYDMIHGNWTYQKSGILDRTHLRFFTKYEVMRLLKQAGYRVVSIEYSTVDMTENINQEMKKIANLLGKEIDQEQIRAFQWIIVGKR